MSSLLIPHSVRILIEGRPASVEDQWGAGEDLQMLTIKFRFLVCSAALPQKNQRE
jgi:hypothetical protein